jgi:hypothetical protein
MRSVEELSRLEWLETNGIGGYASSTAWSCYRSWTYEAGGVRVVKRVNMAGARTPR